MFKNPYLYRILGLTGFVFLLFSLFFRQKFVDIHVYDTFIVCSFMQVLIVFTIIFFLFYFIHNNSKIKALPNRKRQFHVVITLITTVIILAALYLASHAYKPGFDNWNFFEKNNSFLILFIPVYFIFQLGYLFYFVFTIVSKKN